MLSFITKLFISKVSCNNWIFCVSVFFKKSISLVKRQLGINLFLNNSLILSMTSSKEEHFIGKIFLLSDEVSSSSSTSSLSLFSVFDSLDFFFEFDSSLLLSDEDDVSFFL